MDLKMTYTTQAGGNVLNVPPFVTLIFIPNRYSTVSVEEQRPWNDYAHELFKAFFFCVM